MAFLKDLIHRRVPQVVAIYFGACWGLLEFTDFITQRFALSPHIIDLALMVPLLLLPSVVLVTYFHGAPGQDQWVNAEKIGIPINLLVAAVFLVVFFQGKDLGAATTKVVVTDEEGVESEQVIPKEEFRKHLTVYFFEADPADTAAAWLRYGLPVAIQNDLAQDRFIDVRNPMLFPDRLREVGFEELVDVPFPLARELAEEMHRDHFVMGSVGTAGGEISATVSLYDAKRGRLLEERVYTGDDVMDLADRITEQLRKDLKIPDLGEEAAPDLPAAEILTNSPTAYRLSVESSVAGGVERDFALGTSLMEAAVAEDPTFADAQAALGNYYIFTGRAGEAAVPMQAAMDHIYRLPERSRFVVKSNYYFIVRQDMEKAMAAVDMWADLFPDDLAAYQARLQFQTVINDKEGSLATLKKILVLDPAQKGVLLQIGDIHQERGNFAASEEAFQRYADEFPGDSDVLARLGEVSRAKGEFDQARAYYDRALLLAPSNVSLMVAMGTLERRAGDFEEANSQFQLAMAAASMPEERAQVYAALQAYHLQRGQMTKTIEYMELRLAEASSYQPSFLVAQEQLMEAGTYAEAGRAEDALALVEEARGQLPPPFDGLAPLGEVAVHRALEDPEAVESALSELETFIQAFQYEVLRPAVVDAQGAIHELRGEYREAMERYEEELRLTPSSTTVLRQLGRCHRELGEYDEAVALLQEALKASPFGPLTNYELARTYESMDRMDEARVHLNRALEVWVEADPEYKWAQQAREMAARIGR